MKKKMIKNDKKKIVSQADSPFSLTCPISQFSPINISGLLLFSTEKRKFVGFGLMRMTIGSFSDSFDCITEHVSESAVPVNAANGVPVITITKLPS